MIQDDQEVFDHTDYRFTRSDEYASINHIWYDLIPPKKALPSFLGFFLWF